MEGLKKWQEENSDQRTFFLVAACEDGITNAFCGRPLPAVVAFMEAMKCQDINKEILTAAVEADKDPLCKAFVYNEWEDYKKEKGIKNVDGDDVHDNHSPRSFIKDLLKKL